MSLCLSICLSVCPSTWNNCSHWTDFNKILYLSIFFKSIKTELSLKFEKNARSFSWWYVYRCDNTLHSSSWNEKCFRQIYRENQNTHFMFNAFFPQKLCCYKLMWKNVVWPDKPQMTVWYGTCALHGGKLSLQTHTQNVLYLLLFNSNTGYTSALSCDIICTLPGLFVLLCIMRISCKVRPLQPWRLKSPNILCNCSVHTLHTIHCAASRKTSWLRAEIMAVCCKNCT
jgi:hypothetical protein